MLYSEGRFWISRGDSCNSELKMSQHSTQAFVGSLLIFKRWRRVLLSFVNAGQRHVSLNPKF